MAAVGRGVSAERALCFVEDSFPRIPWGSAGSFDIRTQERKGTEVCSTSEAKSS